MNMNHQDQDNQEDDKSKLMVFAEVCYEESKIDYDWTVFSSFPRGKRTRFHPSCAPLNCNADSSCSYKTTIQERLHFLCLSPNNQEDITMQEEEEERERKKNKKVMVDVSIHGKKEEQNHHNLENSNIRYKNNKLTTKKKAIQEDNDDQEPAPHRLLVDLHREMVSTKDPRLIHVFEKRLTNTDVDRAQNRLLLKTKKVRALLLPAFGYSLKDEKGIFKASKGIKVVGLDPMGRPWNLCWKFWTKYHVLDGQWKNLVECNGFQAGLHTVHVSAFRYGYRDSNICFVIDTRSTSDSGFGSGSDYTFFCQDQAILSCQEEDDDDEKPS